MKLYFVESVTKVTLGIKPLTFSYDRVKFIMNCEETMTFNDVLCYIIASNKNKKVSFVNKYDLSKTLLDYNIKDGHRIRIK